MATGDAMKVGIAVPLTNWRTERDYNADGLPDGWGKAGNALTTWRRMQGGASDHLHQWGLSTLGALGIYSVTASDYVWARSRPNSVPVSGDTLTALACVYVCPWHATTDRLKMEVHTLTAAGASITSTNATTGAGQPRGRWDLLTRASPLFDSSAYMVEIRFMDSGSSGNPTRYMIDGPVVGWDARGLAGGLRTMDSPPSVDSALLPMSLADTGRDDDAGWYFADPYAATAKWTLRLQYDYMTVDDYQYWLSCYAVNRGASGFKSASGARLEPMPVVVQHHFFDPADYSADLPSHYLNSGKPPFIVGNITAFDLSAREYLGFGYQGSITIEEA